MLSLPVQVFKDELDQYEKSNPPVAPERPAEEDKTDEMTNDDKADNEEEGPDVVVEEEEEVELDSTGRPIGELVTVV